MGAREKKKTKEEVEDEDDEDSASRTDIRGHALPSSLSAKQREGMDGRAAGNSVEEVAHLAAAER